MKTVLTFFSFFLFFNCSTIAQLQSTWNIALKEPLNPPNTSIYSVTPYQIIHDNDKTIYVNSVARRSWQIAAIDATSGDYKWKALRNYKTPTLDSVQYFPSNIVTDENQNIVELGVRVLPKYPSLSTDGGSIAKAVYDKNTGKELSYIDHIADYEKYFYIPGQPSRYQKSNNGKYYYLFQTSGNAQNRVFLRRIDAKTFSKVDTIHRIVDNTPIILSQVAELFQFGNNKLYYFLTSIDNTKKDTSQYKTVYIRMDSTGKETHKRINISKYLYYYQYFNFFEQCSDGFIVGGSTDSTQLILSGDQSKKLSYIMKIDTSGKLLWRTWYPSTFFGGQIIDSKRLGDEIYLTRTAEGDGYGKKELLILNLNDGKIKNVGEFKIKDETRAYAMGYANAILPNKDFVFSYFYKECQGQVAPANLSCFGVGLISYDDIQKVTSIKEETLLTEKINIYPNPTNNLFQIQLPFVASFDYVITDIAGKIVKQESVLTTNLHEVEINFASKGIYFLTIKTNGNQIFTKKIVKQ